MKKIRKMTAQLLADSIKADSEANKNYCFVLGAGASVSSGIKSGMEMMREWRSFLSKKSDSYLENLAYNTNTPWDKCLRLIKGDEKDLKNDDYFSLYDLRFEGTTNAGYNYLEKQMRSAKPSAGYYYLASILNNEELTNLKLVITTNFDSLSEDSLFYCYGYHPLVIGHERLAHYITKIKDKPIIAKIHRDLLLEPMNRSKEMQSLNEAWKQPLTEILRNHTPIFIGYAGGDETLMSLLKTIDLQGAYWCEMEGKELSEPVKDFLSKSNSYHVTISGFDEIMFLLTQALSNFPDPDGMEKNAVDRCCNYRNEHNKLLDKYSISKIINDSKENDKPISESDIEVAKAVSREENKDDSNISEYNEMYFNALELYNKDDHKAAIELCNKLKELDPFTEENDIAEKHFNLAELFRKYNRFADAEPLYRQALDIYCRLADAKPNTFEPDLAMTCNNLAVLLKNNNHPKEAEDLYNEALSIYRRLAESNPDAFEPDVAMTCNNLAILLSDRNKNDEAEKLYNEALDIYRRLATANPNAFEPALASTCNNLANLLRNRNKNDEAEKLYNGALGIYRKLAVAYPNAFESGLANINSNLGEFFFEAKNDKSTAKKYFKKALCLYEKFPHLADKAQITREYLKKCE